MMTFLNVFRSVGGKLEIHDGPDGGIRFWHPGDELQARSPSRPTCTPAS